MSKTIDYQKLTVNPSLRWWINTKSIFYLQKLMYKFPILGKPFRYIGYRLTFIGQLAEQEKKRLKSIAMITQPKQEAGEFGSEYGYNDAAREFEVTAKYHNQIRQNNLDDQPSESGGLYKHAVERIGRLLSQDKTITDVLNFGVCYAHVDSILAAQFFNVHFIGLDRSYLTKIYNEEYFSKMKNMEFVAGDIFDAVQKRQYKVPCLLHVRTACYLPKDFMERLYKAAFDAGFQYIIGMEQVGVSRQNMKPYEFSENDQPSVIFRDGFFIHNYPGLVTKAGYKVQDVELVKTKHPHEDYRILSLIAKRS